MEISHQSSERRAIYDFDYVFPLYNIHLRYRPPGTMAGTGHRTEDFTQVYDLRLYQRRCTCAYV